jgi:hypothetical protein
LKAYHVLSPQFPTSTTLNAEAAAGVEYRKINDPCSPYSPHPMLNAQPSEESPFGAQFSENDQPNQALPLVTNTSPF